ncbi:MAG: PEP-utilizing enzyme [archaeon]
MPKRLLRTLKESKLRPATRRDLPLLTMSVIGRAYHIMMKDYTGFSYSAVGAIGDEKGFYSLFNEQEIIDGTERLSAKGISKVFKVLKKADSNFEKYLSDAKKANSLCKTEEKLFATIDLYPDFMVSLAVYNCFWRYFGNEESKGIFSAEDVKKISTQRQKIAEEYPKIEERILHLANSLEKESSIPFSVVRFLTLSEAKEFIKKKNKRKGLLASGTKRKKNYFYLMKNGKEIVLEKDDEINKIRRSIFSPFEGYIKYIERKNSFLVFSASQFAHTKLLKKATGFGYSSLLFTYKQNSGTFYYLEKEKLLAQNHFSKMILKNDTKLKALCEKSRKEADKMKRLIFDFDNSDESVNMHSASEIIDSFVKILFHTTIFPFVALYGAELAQQKSCSSKTKELVADMESLRNSGEYPKFVSVVLRPYVLKAAKKLNTTEENAFLLTFGELKSLLDENKSVNMSETLKRNTGCICMGDFDKTPFTINYDQSLFSSLDNQNENATKEIIGKPAFPGIARGKVRIVNTISDLKSFKEGEILVSISTNPSLMPSLSAAAAIVTDEGGIMCHAAIIARELKKPCIIGTKIATRVLKNGMLVEVDANKGTVRILEKV